MGSVGKYIDFICLEYVCISGRTINYVNAAKKMEQNRLIGRNIFRLIDTKNLPSMYVSLSTSTLVPKVWYTILVSNKNRTYNYTQSDPVFGIWSLSHAITWKVERNCICEISYLDFPRREWSCPYCERRPSPSGSSSHANSYPDADPPTPPSEKIANYSQGPARRMAVNPGKPKKSNY